MESPLTVKLITAAVHVGIGLFLIALSVPFVQHRVKPNRYWGFIRTKRMVENADVWYPTNAYAARVMIGAVGVDMLAALVLLPISAVLPQTYILILTALLFGLMLLVVVLTFLYLRRIP
jgi:hypothetical protein